MSEKLAQYDSAAEATTKLLSELFASKDGQEIGFRLWNGQKVTSGNPQYTIVLKHPGALRKMFYPPGEMNLVEAFLRGDFDIEGDIIAAIKMVTALEGFSAQDWFRLIGQIRRLPKTEPEDPFVIGRKAVRLSGATHSRERDRVAVTYHYDVGNSFYALFLGKWMAYSCGYFQDAKDDLDTAQAAKFEHICRKLRLKPGERLLDIGCGWGGLVVYAAEHYGVQAVGITLSQPQVEYGQQWISQAGLNKQAKIELRDYRDINNLGMFDKIVSIGMFEHVGRTRQRAYFRNAYDVLKLGGLFLNHGIAATMRKPVSWAARTFLQRGQFVQRYVFPDGELLPISEALSIAEEERFEVRDVESLREHYALTLQNWVNNLEKNHAMAVDVKDERSYRTWRLYMAASAVGFENGHINVYQALLSKSENGKSKLPLIRSDIYFQKQMEK